MADRFWPSVISVLTGTAMAQSIPLIGSLVIARLFAPADYGYFATWLGFVSIAAVISTGRFEHSLVLEPDGELRRLAVLSTMVTTLLGALVLGFLLSITLVLDVLPFEFNSTLMVVALIPTAFLMAIAQIFQSLAATEGRFYDLSLMRISQAIGITGLQIFVGFFFATATALAITYATGVLIGLFIAAWRMPVCPVSSWRLDFQVRFWMRHRRFPLFSLPADAINTTAGQLPLIIVGSHFGAETAGFLALTMRTLGAPISLLGTAVLDVFKRHASISWRESGQCRTEYLQTFKVLALSSAIAIVVLSIMSEHLFSIAFGERWRVSGIIAVWLLPVFALRFVASPLSFMIYLANKQHADLLWQIGLLAMTVTTLWFPSEFRMTMLCYSTGYSVMYLIYLIMSYRFSLGRSV